MNWLLLLLPALLAAQSVTRDVIEARLRLAGGTNAERAAKLTRLFRDAGCGVTEQRVMENAPPNLICVLPGKSKDVILVGAHFDAKGPGVADNWSGAALLPSLYEDLKKSAPVHTFLFVGFTEEEKGLIGSRFYVSRMTAEDRRRAKAMVNIDTLGLANPNVWVSKADRDLTYLAGYVASEMKIPLSVLEIGNLGTTDSESFEGTGIPRIAFSSLDKTAMKKLHSKKDNIDAIRLDDYYQTFQLLARFLQRLDQLENVSAFR